MWFIRGVCGCTGIWWPWQITHSAVLGSEGAGAVVGEAVTGPASSINLVFHSIGFFPSRSVQKARAPLDVVMMRGTLAALSGR